MVCTGLPAKIKSIVSTTQGAGLMVFGVISVITIGQTEYLLGNVEFSTSDTGSEPLKITLSHVMLSPVEFASAIFIRLADMPLIAGATTPAVVYSFMLTPFLFDCDRVHVVVVLRLSAPADSGVPFWSAGAWKR
jgi:hypothetical protein